MKRLGVGGYVLMAFAICAMQSPLRADVKTLNQLSRMAIDLLKTKKGAAAYDGVQSIRSDYTEEEKQAEIEIIYFLNNVRERYFVACDYSDARKITCTSRP